MAKGCIKYEIILHIADIFLCCFVFFPFMVFYWRGIWDLWGVYIYPDEHPKQEWTLFGITSSVTIISYFILPVLDNKLDDMETETISWIQQKVCIPFIKRLYMHTYGAFYMGYWRSIWTLSEFYVPSSLLGSVLNFVCPYMVIVMLRGLRCVILPPMCVTLDTRNEFLRTSTRFNTKPNTVRYIFDCMLSHFVILGCAIISWRGLWTLLGELIYPKDPIFATYMCLILGYCLALLLFIFEEPLARVTTALEKRGFYYKLLWEDVIYTFIFICNVILWRGGWNYVSTFILPDFEVGGWVCFITGSIGLTFLQLFTYACAHGVVVDGSDEGRGAFFPTKYLRVYLKSNLKSKENRQVYTLKAVSNSIKWVLTPTSSIIASLDITNQHI